MSELEKNAVLESFDETEYEYTRVMGNDPVLPTSHEVADKIVQNQGAKKKTAYYCVAYSTSSGSNAMNEMEGSEVYLTGEELGDIMVGKDRMDADRGAYIKDGPKTAKELKYLRGYFYAKTLEEIKHAISSDRPLVCGSNNINWGKTRKNNNVAVEGKSYGHAFLCMGYDDETQLLKMENSYGKDRYDGGYFYVRYEDIEKLLFQSKIVLIDEQDIMTNYRKDILEDIDHEPAQKAFVIGIWNGLEPREQASRQEVATMIFNALKLIK